MSPFIAYANIIIVGAILGLWLLLRLRHWGSLYLAAATILACSGIAVLLTASQSEPRYIGLAACLMILAVLALLLGVGQFGSHMEEVRTKRHLPPQAPQH